MQSIEIQSEHQPALDPAQPVAKPIFKIINEGFHKVPPPDDKAGKESRWTTEEHRAFVEGSFCSLPYL